jgi:uncharacterized membrane protein YhaH (DUF805 family)
MDLKNMFLTADGRIGRKEFWIGILILLGANVVAGFIPFVGLLISLFLLYCSVCLYSSRLHDFGKSGWLQLVPWIANFVGIVLTFVLGGAAIFAAAASGEQPDPAFFASLGGVALVWIVVALISFVFMLWVGLSKGDPSANRYGPPPGSVSGSTEIAPGAAS